LFVFNETRNRAARASHQRLAEVLCAVHTELPRSYRGAPPQDPTVGPTVVLGGGAARCLTNARCVARGPDRAQSSGPTGSAKTTHPPVCVVARPPQADVARRLEFPTQAQNSPGAASRFGLPLHRWTMCTLYPGFQFSICRSLCVVPRSEFRSYHHYHTLSRSLDSPEVNP
jgi:hypothetical protein